MPSPTTVCVRPTQVLDKALGRGRYNDFVKLRDDLKRLDVIPRDLALPHKQNLAYLFFGPYHNDVTKRARRDGCV